MASIANELATALSTVRTPGDFYATGACAIPLPRLEVDGVGPIALPLLPTQAGQLIAVAERAPYGRGEETLVDTEVRRTWQIGAERVRIEGRNWARTLSAIVARAAAGLGVTETVVPALYKLLVYDQGSFFVSHRDTEKAPGMFATLIIALPSVHTGGELVIRHRGREVLLNLRCEDPSEAAFAAFYADCVHEVLPVISGCRLALVYNLLRKGGRLPKPPIYDIEQARLTALLQGWVTSKQSPNGTSPAKLVYPLEHAYTPAELSFPALKGADAAAAGVLTAAAQRSGCDLHVALLTIHESGSAEHTGYAGSRRWRRADEKDEEDEEEFEIVEVCDRSPMLSNWGRPDGSQAALGVFPFDNAELCPSDALDDMEPDEQYFQEATGNEGASFERTYKRAALVLWPQQRRLAVFNQAGLAVTLPYLGELAVRWAQSGEGHDSPLWREAHELSGHMLSRPPFPAGRAKRERHLSHSACSTGGHGAHRDFPGRVHCCWHLWQERQRGVAPSPAPAASTARWRMDRAHHRRKRSNPPRRLRRLAGSRRAVVHSEGISGGRRYRSSPSAAGQSEANHSARNCMAKRKHRCWRRRRRVHSAFANRREPGAARGGSHAGVAPYVWRG